MTDDTMTTGFRVHPIPAEVLDRVRACGTDVSGFATERPVAVGGEPLRCCLRDARPGEDLLLFGYEPPLPPSPYREIGAVFAHALPCDGPDTDGYPPDWYGRPQVVRAYDDRGRIHPATRIHDGAAPEAVLSDLLAVPDVACVHSRNIAYGCFMFAATPAG